MEKAREYFAGQKLPADVWSGKYALEDIELGEQVEETPDEMHGRMAHEFGRVEETVPKSERSDDLSVYGRNRDPLTEDTIYGWFSDFDGIIPQGSIMSLLGNPYQVGVLSNCVVIPPAVDSYGGIMYSDQTLAQLMKRRAGVGLDISQLRPQGATVRNAAKTSSGAVSFMDRFSSTTNEVAQKGRRGALMLTIDCRHPDLEAFIRKKEDLSSVSGANISVKWRDEFVDAANKGESYTLRWPVDADPEEAEITKEVNAKRLYNQAAESAWESGDPGCMFIDRMNNYSTDYGYPGLEVTTTNPCQPGRSTLLTPSGMTTMANIEEGDTIWSEDGWVNVVNKVRTGTKPVYCYHTTAGNFYSTEDHRIKEHGEKIEVQHADEIDLLAGPNDATEIDQQAVVDGLMLGDGSYHEQSANPFYLNVGENDQDYFDDPVSELIGESHAAHHGRANKVATTLTKKELCKLWNREVPRRYFRAKPNKVCSFLRGLYSANGSICAKRVTLKTTSKRLVEQVQQMLSSVGIRSYYTTNPPSVTEHRNGEYESRESYDINITTDRGVFFDRIGFIQNYKMDRLREIIQTTETRDRRKSHEIIEVERVGAVPVYDITVDGDSHTYWTHGFNSSNCGEIGMPPNDTCRLIAPNLFSAVRNPFEANAEVDHDYLYRMYYEAQRLSDDLVTLEIEYMQRVIDKINRDDEDERYKRTEREIWEDLIESARKYRRTGLGFTALGDTLAAMGVRYGSQEGNELTDAIMRTKMKGEWDASIDMAIERGPFPEWSPEHDDTEFFDMLKDEFPDIYSRNMEHGRRNISISTVAPTGSVSLMAKVGDGYGSTSGIEPVFTTEPLKLWHTRRRRTNPGEEPDYVDENGNEWVEYTVFHTGVKEWAKAQDVDLTEHGYNEETGLVEDEDKMKSLLAESPYNGATSSELDAKDRIDLQAVVQKYTTHSISSTLNLPNDCPESRVREIYEYGHEAGLKGVTIFRDGSKSGVLADSGGSSGFEYNDAPKRPERLECRVHKLRRNGDQWKIFVGMYEGKPYEVFACTASMRLVDSDNHAFDEGYIDKAGSGTYRLVAPDEKVVLEDIADNMPSSEIEALTRMISMALRHGAKMDWIVTQLDKAEGSVASFSKALSSVLMEHMEEPVTCSECGSEDVSFQEGCLTCRSCGASKCG